MPPVSAGVDAEREREKSVRLQDVDLQYEIAGNGPPVVCIQGVGVPKAGWRPQVEDLATRFQVITFDNRGIGRSSRGRSPLTIEAMAADVVGLMDAEGIDRFHVMGHSMGGLIAQHVGLTARDRVKSLSLLCTFANGRDATALSLQMLVHGIRSRVGTRTMRRNGMMRMIMPADYLAGVDRARLAEQLQRLFGRDLADQPPVLNEQLHAMSRYSAAARLPQLSGIPTLVMSGFHDPIAPPRLGKAIAASIRGARYVEFADAGHALPIQLAREVNSLLLDHLATADSSLSGC
jgi:pimeloyl-ACP methyl ester carboxylesterase